jgi:protein SCO1
MKICRAVTPAKAGPPHVRRAGSPVVWRPGVQSMFWVPAFAGMTAFILCMMPSAAFPRTLETQQKILDKVGFVQKLDDQVPLSLQFRNEAGQPVLLGSYFTGNKPVLLNLVYFECPMLCTEVLNGIIRTLKVVPLKVGHDFNVVTVSFDPRETSKMAAAKKRVYLDRYGKTDPETADGWAFLTGDVASIQSLANAVGFSYSYDPEINEFAHASGIMILTPQGKIAHYFFGVEYPSKDVRLSLLEASNGKIGSLTDQLLLYCYHYDPETGRYGVLIMRVLRIAAMSTAAILAAFVFVMLMRERSNRMATRNV